MPRDEIQFVIAVDYDTEKDMFILVDENGVAFTTSTLIHEMLGRIERSMRNKRVRNLRNRTGEINGESK